MLDRLHAQERLTAGPFTLYSLPNGNLFVVQKLQVGFEYYVQGEKFLLASIEEDLKRLSKT